MWLLKCEGLHAKRGLPETRRVFNLITPCLDGLDALHDALLVSVEGVIYQHVEGFLFVEIAPLQDISKLGIGEFVVEPLEVLNSARQLQLLLLLCAQDLQRGSER